MSTPDVRGFLRWVTDDLEPSIRLGTGRYPREPGGVEPDLYGVADMACVLWSLRRLRPTPVERAEWQRSFADLQDPATGWFVEREPSHHELHRTAFALGALDLLDLDPPFPLRGVEEWRDPTAGVAHLDGLDWHGGVYVDSHRGAGLASIFAVRDDVEPAWFDAWFAAADARFDPANGMMGVGKPSGGDLDQVGGTFHYHFLYEHFHRRMPHPEARVDAVLGLQRPEGCWHPANPLWLTLDGVYLLTRTVRWHPARVDDVRVAVRASVAYVWEELLAPARRADAFAAPVGVHGLTAAVSLLAEAQAFLGADELPTDRPLRLVLDRRPFV